MVAVELYLARPGGKGGLPQRFHLEGEQGRRLGLKLAGRGERRDNQVDESPIADALDALDHQRLSLRHVQDEAFLPLDRAVVQSPEVEQVDYHQPAGASGADHAGQGAFRRRSVVCQRERIAQAGHDIERSLGGNRLLEAANRPG